MEKDRYQDFLCMLKCISDKTLIDNIALHLLLDVGKFYSKNSIQGLRYSEETIAFWVTVVSKHRAWIKQKRDISVPKSVE